MSEYQSLLTIASHFHNLSRKMTEDTCRMCLQRGEKFNFISLDFGQPSIRSKLAAFMPELNLEIVKDPVVCGPCAAALDNAYQLKIRCLRTDGKIWSRIQSNMEFGAMGGPVKLLDILQATDFRQEEITVEPSFNYYHYDDKLGNKSYQSLDANDPPKKIPNDRVSVQIGDVFVCTTCKESFVSKEELHFHIPKHFGTRPYMCPYCYKCFTLKSNLQIHQRTHTQDRPFNCEFCEKCFTTKGNLKTHVRVHTKEKPYVCDICDKAFIQKVQLNTHMLLHQNENIFACDVCKKTFSTKYTLVVHKRIHEEVKPFVCEECNKCFTTNGNLSVHMRKHTGEKPYECTVCEKSFSQSGQLKLHIKKHHSVSIPSENEAAGLPEPVEGPKEVVLS